MSKKKLLFEIANKQKGYFTFSQACTCGYPDSHMHQHVASGDWLRVNRGLYRLRDWEKIT